MVELPILLQNSRLTTAEIIYHLPDYPDIVQSFVWQDYDLPPNYPKLRNFLEFWSRSLEGKLHSVRVVSADHFAASDIKAGDFLETLY